MKLLAINTLQRLMGALGFRTWLSLTISLGVGILTLATSVGISWMGIVDARRDLVMQGRLLTERMAAQSTLALLYGAPENAHDATEALLAFPNVVAAGIYDTDGKALLEIGAMDMPRPSAASNASRRARLEQDSRARWVFIAPVYAGGSTGMAAGSPFEMPAAPELVGHVRLVLSKAALTDIARRVFASNLAISTAIALVLLLALHWLTGRITGPLRELAQVMGRAEAGEAQVRAAMAGPRDVKLMERAFNKMMERIEEREVALSNARDQALEAARVKAQFAAHVSHELRTPLNGLLGMIQLLRDTSLSPKQGEYVAVAESSGQTLLAVINDILDFSRSEAGRIQIEAREFEPRRRVEEVVGLLRETARRKGLSLGCQFGPEVPALVVGDPVRIGQVLTNLVGNAIKFTREGGVTVRVGATPTGQAQTVLRFSVTDTGIGIPAEAQDRIFESFTQADASTTREYGGSGLGLTISRQLVELMGGRLGVESAVGRGSTFWFTLTLPVAAQLPAAPRLAGLRLLLAAPGDGAYLALAEQLVAQGAVCRHLDNGGQVLIELARPVQADGGYDAVLVADTLAEMGGSALLRYLRMHPVRRNCRVYFLAQGPTLPHLPDADGVLLVDGPPDALIGALSQLRAQPRTSPAQTPQTRPRVLVAEDNPASQLVARGLLEAAGCAVDTVATGREALDAVARTDYALVFMDCNMPELDGFAATAAIRAHRAGRPLPIVAMTANTDPADVARCRTAGMDDYLAKPVQLAGVNEMLSRWLPADGRTPAPPEAMPEPRVPDARDPVMDDGILIELRAAMGDAVDEVIRTFSTDADRYVSEMRAAVGRDDLGRARELAHLIKGSARNIGALHLASAAEGLEQTLRAGNRALVTAALATLVSAREEVHHALAEAGPVAVPATVPGTGPRVLIVEDDRSTRLALRGVLEHDGYQISEAADGAEAIALYRRVRPDLVLMDALLPVQDGFTACREIYQLPAHERVPVLMITSLDDEVSVERAFRAGAADFIPKPINFGVLRRRARRLLAARASEQSVQRLAYHDTLTGLVNRSALRERLAQDLAQPLTGTLALVFLDLDRFKLINDTLGHDAGDEMLIEVTSRLRGCLPGDATLARVGSDEFAAVLMSPSPEAVAQVAEQVLTALRAPLRLQGRDVVASASVGIGLHPTDGADPDTLLNHAETAATRAKEQGGGAYHFYQPRMSTVIRDRLELEHDLRKALDREQLLLFYQPQLHLRSGKVLGVEALLRWRHPQRGLVSPGEFIPLAEETGLIAPIGEWVLREACAQARQWRERGLPALRMAVNLSARQLAAPELADTVTRALKETGYDAHDLELEVTESVLMSDRERAVGLLRRLRALGVRIAIDDFGTGYSSLGYLKHLPVDTLKIDRSFVGGLPEDAHDAAITTGVINLARSLGIEVVAEGVETGAQLRFLREQSCDVVQGYLIHTPAPAAAFESWMEGRGRIQRPAS